MKIIVGFGNPEKKYAKNRHNVGFHILEDFQATFNDNFSNFKTDKKHNSSISEGKISDETILLVKPLNYYNETGRIVKSLMDYYKVDLDEIIIIHDDIDLPIGSIRISKDSNAAGNNGVKSLISALGTKNFIRVRIGIFNTTKEHKQTQDFVLGNFSIEDKKILKNVLPILHQILIDLVEQYPNVETVQNIYN